MTSLVLRILLPVILAAPFPFTEELRRGDVATGPLYSSGWHPAEVRWAEERLPRLLEEVESRLGRRLGKEFTTVLVHGPGELARIAEELGAAPPRGTTRGIAFPAQGVIVVRGDLLDGARPRDDSEETLGHEIAHLVLHRRPGIDLPRWLDEGIAEWASGGRLPSGEEARLSLLARTGSIYRLDTLHDAFPQGDVSTTLAYKQSLLFVLFLAERHGEQAIGAILDRLEGGEPSREVIEDVTGLSQADLEEAFRLWLVARRSLIEAVGTLVWPWTAISLLALVAIGRYLVRRRRALRRMEREEEAEDERDEEYGEEEEEAEDGGDRTAPSGSRAERGE